MPRRRPPPPPPAPPPGLPAGPGLAPGQLLLIYSPDGPLGGTFICTACRAQAWQPDLLAHAPACPQGHPARG
ncbi:MAG: hypothetical protein JNM33_07670 [Rubrivivax sp.]|nr:hypothetical protein [Rubrivivax sp.]